MALESRQVLPCSDVRLTTYVLYIRQLGHFLSAGVPIKRRLGEFRVTPDALLPVGTVLNAVHFTPGQYVDIQGTFIGASDATLLALLSSLPLCTILTTGISGALLI
jgi:hypothetical protein